MTGAVRDATVAVRDVTVAVRVEGLTRRFGRRWALRGVDLDIDSGASVALLGSNGTGKTTLLRVLSTLLRPTAGRVEVLGQVLPGGAGGAHGASSTDAVRRRSTLMTPHGHAYEELTGLENLRFAARMSGPAVESSRLLKTLDDVGLEDAAHTAVRAYSTGMRKRLELARLSLRTLELVLLDEPFASLDDEGVSLVQAAIGRWRDGGATVVVASHRTRAATERADRVVRLEHGRVASDEPS